MALRTDPSTRPRRIRLQAGFSLMELLVGASISMMALTALSTVTVQQIRVTDLQHAAATNDRGFRRLAALLRTEVDEACLLRTDTNPRTTATAPDTPCNPEVSSPCTATAGTDLRLLIPTLDAAGTNTITYNVVRYYRSGNELLRDGPRVANDGSLTTTALNGQRVITNVTSFVPTVSADCRSVDISLQQSVPGTNQSTPARTLSLAAGATMLIY